MADVAMMMLDRVSDNREVAIEVWRAIMIDHGWDGRDHRVRLDNPRARDDDQID